MVLPRGLAAFNRVVTNPVARHVVSWMPGFGLVVHTGRRSGRVYRTPVNVFRAPGGYVLALTYGADTDWVKNVMAAGRCEVITRRRPHSLTAPRIVRGQAPAGVPLVVRAILGMIGVTEFLQLTEAQDSGDHLV